MSLDALLPSRKHSSHGDGHWIPLSDLMTGLMMVFMLVAIVFMIHVQEDAKKSKQQALRAEADARSAERQAIVVKSIALIYEQMRLKLYDDLYKEFAADLPAWGAEILH